MQYPSGVLAPWQWLRAHRATADAALASAVFVLILLSSVLGSDTYRLTPVDIGLAAPACASLGLRRRAPWSVLAFTCGLSAVFIALRPADGRVPVILAAAMALYTVAARTDRHTTWLTGLAVCVGLTALAMSFGNGPWYGQANFAVFAWTGMAAAAGDAVRSRRAYIAAVEERAERAERSREQEARRRVAEERMRIARELHDVVAHHIALVNVQAGVAAHVMDSRPDQAKQALAHVREASRTALAELRTTVGLLRQSGEPEAPMEPAPGLAVLDQLLDGFRRAGLRVTVECDDPEPGGPEGAEPAALPASVDLTAYRVIQESLTNVQKHAGPRAGAVVRISRVDGELRVVVDDDGAPGRAAGAPPPLFGGLPPQAGGEARGRTDRERTDRERTSREQRAAAGEPRAAAGAHGTGGGGGRPGAGSGAGTGGGDAAGPDAAGPGGAAPDGGAGGGHGLLGMHERASALGGVCRTGARPGGGFRVSVRLPLTVPPHGAAAPSP
ncbi:putative two-component system sensor kinase [Actinacidiphila reveromycinica]|uniref:histidine kinase n=1 Tax=Actinacidiphila reveromycinica TaxID=659352 RepID=A0A7U3VMR2_9ACTN|nr:putative two-component system sensor kinase [Streptomyces sp. SN-593]